MSDIFTLQDYTDKFPLIADQIRETLDDYGKELDAKDEESMEGVMTIMVEVGKMHALQAIALGIQELVKKGN